MKKTPSRVREVRAEYDFSGGVRGKYAKRYARGSNVVVLDPDVAEAFPTARAVNAALRKLLRQTTTGVMLLAVAPLAGATPCLAAQSVWQPSAGHVQIPLWPSAAPDARAGVGPEAVHYAFDEASKTRKLIGGKPYIYIENVTRPTITVYSPTAGKNRAAVVVFPGGGFNVLAMDIEGTEVCDWLVAQGVACVLLKYRVPCQHVGAYRDCPSAHQDAQRAMRIVRSRASEWNIDPRRIGVLGFSAGAHMAIMSSTRFDRSYKPVDAADSASLRPDFALVLYPGRMAYRHSGFKPNPDIRVTAATPPTFLMHARDDKTNAVENSLLYAEALRKAGVAADVHLYEKGGHAFGLRQTGQAASEWPQRAEAWLKRIGVIGS